MRRQICNKVRHSGGVRHPVVDGVSSNTKVIKKVKIYNF